MSRGSWGGSPETDHGHHKALFTRNANYMPLKINRSRFWLFQNTISIGFHEKNAWSSESQQKPYCNDGNREPWTVTQTCTAEFTCPQIKRIKIMLLYGDRVWSSMTANVRYRNNGAPWRNRGKRVSVTYFCVSAQIRVGMCLRACNFSYLAQNAHAPHCHLRPLWLHQIFQHYLVNGSTIFGGWGGMFLNTKSVFIFSTTFLKYFSF